MSLTMTLPIHTPVLVKEVTEALQVQPGRRYIDCTVGSGGHAAAILEESFPVGQLLGIDIDPKAIDAARARLADYPAATLVNGNFTDCDIIAGEKHFLPAHGILFDLGISSPQLDSADRGFSFQRDAPLDMRFNPTQEKTAYDIINTLPEDELARLIRNYGEEHYSKHIAKNVVRNRPVKTTLDLARLVEQATGYKRGKIHPATRTFLALRIAVNQELENLNTALSASINCLDYHGRLVVISYHSLEDRVVKQFMKRESSGCLCPPGIPICQCNHTPSLKLISKKVITPSLTEIESNPRSRSARLRVAELLKIQKEISNGR